MTTEFQQVLWESWLNGTLDWSDFSTIPSVREDEYRTGATNQEWKLQDPNRFYHPLFGLGSTDSEIAVIAKGPAYNDGSLWGRLTDDNGRESIAGPPGDHNHRAWPPGSQHQNPYPDDFETQREFWERTRYAEENNLVDELGTLLDSVKTVDCTSDERIFDDIYFTNFLKDGEFMNDSQIDQANLNFELGEQRDNGRYYYEDVDEGPDSNLIPDTNEWPEITNE